MNALEIQSLINAKEKRQFILEERKKKIEEIEENLNITFWGTTFKGFYYLLKRGILLLLAVMLIVSSLLIFFNSEIINPNKFKQELINDIGNSNYNENNKTWKSIYRNTAIEIFENRNWDATQIERTLQKNIEKEYQLIAENQYNEFRAAIVILFLILAAFILYISRLTKKLKERNDLILESDDLAQQIIDDYNKTLQEERDELQSLKKAYLGSSHI